jgi:hypothetical protein
VTPEQLVAVLVAVAGVLTAVGIVIQQLAALRKDLNGRLTQLLEETRMRAMKEGELRARDYIGLQQRRSTDPQTRTDVPLDVPADS